MRKFIASILIAAVSVVGVAGAVGADPDFGPGNSSKGPQDPGARCHPPGQVLPSPECK